MPPKINLKQFFVGPIKAAIWGCFFLVLLSSVVFVIANYAIKKNIEVRLIREMAKIEDLISNRMQVYANSLLSVRSFLYNLEGSSREELNLYIEDLQLFERYPGMKGLGYAEILSRNDLTDNAYRLSRLVSNFSLEQYSLNSENYAIATSIYPQDLLNQKVLGFDMLSEPLRKAAAETSILTDRPSLSGVVQLSQDRDDPNRPKGFVMFFPVYKVSDPRIDRKIQNASGLLFISLRSLDFFSAIFGDQSLARERVGFSIDIIDKNKLASKLYDRFEDKKSKKAQLTRSFELYGQTMSISVYPLDNFYTAYDKVFPYVVSLFTLLLCALVFLTIRNNANYATELSTTNHLLNLTLNRQKEKQEDLTILNRTLQKMSHTLEVDKIVESFIQGLSEIYENKGKFAIYATSKNSSPESQAINCHIISSNDDSFFVSDCKIDTKNFHKIFSNRNDEGTTETVDFSFLMSEPRFAYHGIYSKIESSVFGENAFTVFISTSSEIDESESVLFETQIKHLNSSIQNSLLLKKVEDANQSKNAFLANMSHEIRTPLNAIMGFSEMLIRDDIKADSKKDLSTNIIRNGQQLTRLVDDILDLSKIEAGKIFIDKKRVDFFELLAEIKSIMNMRIQNNSVEFKIEVDGKIPQFIETDQVRLKQILTNLIGNSIKFTSKGLVRLRISYEADDDHKSRMIFRVEDTGIGIEKDFRYRLFLPFSQADGTSTRKFGGTGLGLAISKRLANELGGDLNLAFSEKDIGSIFELVIPMEELADQIWTENIYLKDIENKSSQKNTEEFLKMKKILLVEDSPDNQDFFNFFLTQAGGNVKIVSNGLEAVEEAKKETYDIILMDIQIPGIDGKEATRRIRSQGFNGPIVALTAHAMAEEQKSCINAGCNGQISKPVSGEVLVNQVSKFIGEQNATAH
jgi:signal transduction histidine kinase/CHASE1-domain containing sensor protein/ActR/RegA family two-component response regulator